MNKLVAGMVFLLISTGIRFNMGLFSIELLPDLVGYFILAVGLAELGTISPGFRKLVPWSVGLGVAQTLWTVISFLDEGGAVLWIWFVFNLALVLMLYFVIKGMVELESKYNVYLESTKLKVMWVVFSALHLFPLMQNKIHIVIYIVKTIVTIVFLWFWDCARKELNNQSKGYL